VFADNGDHIYFEVATLYGGGFRNHEEARSTARMIAAAPDLYAACKAAWNDPSTSREIAVMLEAALAKAVAQ
jgi:hypothetical protein